MLYTHQHFNGCTVFYWMRHAYVIYVTNPLLLDIKIMLLCVCVCIYIYIYIYVHAPWYILHSRQAGGWGFPGGAVVENLPATAGDTGSSPGLGRSYMPRSNCAREPQLLSLRVWSLCSSTREAAIVRGPCTAMKSGPRLPQLEKALAQKRRPNTAIN